VLPPGGAVYILGGTFVLSAQVDQDLARLGYAVQRIAGPYRYGTASLIAGALGSPSAVFEVSGVNFPDGLSSGAAAAVRNGAILLTNGSAQSPATSSYLAAHPAMTRYAVGGPASEADPSATAIVGSDRYDTSVRVAQQFFPAPHIVGVASGLNYPDALASGALMATLGGPVLLTDPQTLSASPRTYLTANKGAVSAVELFGGTFALSDQVAAQIQSAL
jgi:putative cell wall-binding protein